MLMLMLTSCSAGGDGRRLISDPIASDHPPAGAPVPEIRGLLLLGSGLLLLATRHRRKKP